MFGWERHFTENSLSSRRMCGSGELNLVESCLLWYDKAKALYYLFGTGWRMA